ncbi:MAG: enoyl-CoA hydratase/isomerase family protein [Mycobacteriaceae bacterium]|nr:enoyl-CoA hydratase/isomerase family protein [Mycobacteriaceae bacterium]
MTTVKLETSDDVAVVTMANPPANLFDGELMAGLLDVVHSATSEGVRAMVLRSDGPLFSGGADVSMFKETSQAQARAMFDQAFGLIQAIEEAPFPVIAAVHGLCLAAGLELALACDLIVAAEGTQFGQVEAKIGATTFLGGAYRIAQRAGTARAFEVTFGGDLFDAATFERWNIVNRVVPADELDAHASRWARQLAAGPTAAHAVTKRLVHHATDHGVRHTDRYLLDAATPLFATRDMQHAVDLLLTQGAAQFMARHHEVVFEGR